MKKRAIKKYNLEEAEKILSDLALDKSTREEIDDRPIYNNLRNEYADRDNVAINSAITIYKGIIFDQTVSKLQKVTCMCSFAKRLPKYYGETLSNLRDSIQFLREPEKEQTVELLISISLENEIESYDRCLTGVYLFNYGYIEKCSDIFICICQDKNCDLQHRVESCIYLYVSELDNNVNIALDAIKSIIVDYNISSNTRYCVISKFCQNNIKTYFSSNRLRVPINLDFNIELNTLFFFDVVNEIRDRILSARNILQLTTDTNIKEKIIKQLFDIGQGIGFNVDISKRDLENIKADALDIILCKGTLSQAKIAREMINKLGGSESVYSSSQSVHDEQITESVHKIVEDAFENFNKYNRGLGKDMLVKIFDKALPVVNEMIRNSDLSKSSKYAAYGAIKRITMDSATFTSRDLRISDIFALVWLKIINHSAKETLCKRFLEELTEMDETCSSGHTNRLVNVLSGIDVTLGISFENQIVENIKGRMLAKIRDIEDENLKEIITLATMSDSTEEQKNTYKEFVDESLANIKLEMVKEFVPTYIDQKRFDAAFETGSKKWS